MDSYWWMSATMLLQIQSWTFYRKQMPKYVYGVTATPFRGDGLEKINYMLLGPIRYKYTSKDRAKEQGIEHLVYPRLDTLIMATPVAWKGIVEQYAARLNRDYAGKKNVIIYDYVDRHISMFDRMYHKRLKAYKQIGYDIFSGTGTQKQTTNAIFDIDNYADVYRNDLLTAEKEIIISSPAISAKKVYDMIHLLREKQETGIKIVIVTWKPDCYGYGDSAYWQVHIK